MSVPKPKRVENKLEALKRTEEAVAYIIRMCQNEKCFPKRVRWTLANRLIETGLEVILDIKEANKVKPTSKEWYQYRLDKSYEALLKIDRLWTLITLSEKTLSIPVRNLEVCSNLLYDAETIVSAWRDSDIRKFKKDYETS